MIVDFDALPIGVILASSKLTPDSMSSCFKLYVLTWVRGALLTTYRLGLKRVD